MSCPQQITVASQVITPPDGWEVPLVGEGGESKHYLVSSMFTDGPPIDKAFLKPSKTTSGTNLHEEVLYYDFFESTKRGVWLVCMYGNTAAVVAKRLPEEIMYCKAKLPRDSSEQQVFCQ